MSRLPDHPPHPEPNPSLPTCCCHILCSTAIMLGIASTMQPRVVAQPTGLVGDTFRAPFAAVRARSSAVNRRLPARHHDGLGFRARATPVPTKETAARPKKLGLTPEVGKLLYRDMYLGREFEEMCAQMYYRGKMFGFVHLYSGQEAVSTGGWGSGGVKICVGMVGVQFPVVGRGAGVGGASHWGNSCDGVFSMPATVSRGAGSAGAMGASC